MRIQLPINVWLRRLFSTIQEQLVTDIDPQELPHSAIIFSPHQDDETLGCGGIIIHKRNAGSDIKIVYMTDGRQSHGHLISVDELITMRKREALAASKKLGLDEQSVIFLDNQDGTLHEICEAVIQQVEQLLQQLRPEEIFIPYSKEPTSDHQATNRIVLSALHKTSLNTTVYEYPVWFWHHWPWVSLWQNTYGGTFSVLKNTLFTGIGLVLFKDFRSRIMVEDVLDQKGSALQQHHTQMTRINSDPRWMTLHDICNGEFLSCFFGKQEIFHRYSFHGNNSSLNKPRQNYR
jgi:LmbE family N-acetylglucosaminyl deacetylase